LGNGSRSDVEDVHLNHHLKNILKERTCIRSFFLVGDS
jgi:hypothetical protein